MPVISSAPPPDVLSDQSHKVRCSQRSQRLFSASSAVKSR